MWMGRQNRKQEEVSIRVLRIEKGSPGQDTHLLHNADLLVRMDHSQVSDCEFFLELMIGYVAYTIYCTCKFVGGEGINVVVFGLEVAT
jgi:hypothetical protein